MNRPAQKLRARAFVSALVLVAAGMLAGGVQARTAAPSPVTRDAAASQSIPRVGNGVFGPALPTPSGPITVGARADGRSPDTRDAAASQAIPRVGNGVFGPALPTPSGPITGGARADGRSPDTRDAATLAHSPVVTPTKPSEFAWREFGIGAAAAVGAILLLLGVGAVLLAGRGRGEVARPTVSV
jgi:hypothetical protein